ncbi:MAG: hypothetical protein ACOC5T_03565 [Elusimicrobiota bacterium]
MNIQTSVNDLKEILGEYLIDPISRRTSKWIYDEDGRAELDKSPFPKIVIRVDSPSTKEPNAMGSYQTFNTDNLEVLIKAKMGSHYGLGDKKYTGKEFVAEISKQIEEVLRKKEVQDEFYNKCYTSVLPVGEYFEFDRDKNPTFVLQIQMKYVNKS